MAIVVGVFPSSATEEHATTWRALGAAFGVTFVDGRHHRGPLAATITVGPDDVPRGIPTLELATTAIGTDRRHADLVTLASTGDVDARLRGRTVAHHGAGGLVPLPPAPGSRALACGAHGTLWDRTPGRDRCAAPPPTLQPGERLKDHLKPGRFLALLAVCELLRTVTGYASWQRPPALATITFDDPNLRTTRYGFLHFGELARHSRRHGYHVGIAMVPLGATATRTTADHFRASPHLSLLAHGNTHVRAELLEDRPARAAAIAFDAARRLRTFERRTGLHVARVMVPPHGACSRPMMDALLQAGFEAVSYTGPPGHDSLVGWRPADIHLGAGLPGMHRVGLLADPADLALRAYLDQPLCLYGHHDDVADGLDVLVDAQARVESVAPAVRWSSLEGIARRAWRSRRVGASLVVRTEAPIFLVDVPAGVERVVVQRCGDDVDVVRPLRPGPLRVDARRLRTFAGAAPRVGRSPWPMTRRIAAEARDRLQPLLARRAGRRLA